MIRSLRLAGCVTLAASLLAVGAAKSFGQTAATGDGNWSTGTSPWSAGEPTNGLPATIDGGFTITVDQFGEVTNALGVGTISGETGNLNIVDGFLEVFDADTVTPPNLPAIGLGVVAGATGNLAMSGGTVFIDGGPTPDVLGAGDLLVGVAGTGSMTMTGGDLTAADEIFIGQEAGSTGTLTVEGGLIQTAARNMLVGFGGNGTLNLSDTGTVNIAGVLFSSFIDGSTSTINQTGGALTVTGDIVYGRQGSSVINHSSGTLSGAKVMVIGDGIDLPPEHTDYEVTYNISGDAVVDTNWVVWLGAFGNAHGIVNQTGGTFNAGALTVGRDGTGTYNLSAGTTLVEGTDGWAPNNHLIVGGVGSADNVQKGDGFVHQTGGTMTVTTGVFLGNFDNTQGIYKISGGTLNVTGSGSHSNPLDFEDFLGDFSVGGALASNATTIRVDPVDPNDPQGQALDARGEFIVSGSAATINIAGNFLANPADKHANRKSLSPGDLRDNSATLGFEIFNASGTSLIDVAGVADLDGAVIDLDLMGGFLPAINTTFALLTASSFGATGAGTTQNVGTGMGFTIAPEDVGAFSVAVVPGGNGQILQATFLGAVPADDADFDDDGDVDGADFLTWQRGLGVGATNAQGDANGDSVVDGADLTVWRSEFGPASVPAVGAVPEPGSAALLLIAAAGFAASRTGASRLRGRRPGRLVG